MKKIFGLVLALVLLVPVFAVFPAAAEGEAANGNWSVLLNDGINLNYYDENGVKLDGVTVAAKELAVEQTLCEKTTTVEAYLNGLIAGDYGENTKALAQALLDYGAAAYEYFNAKGKCEGIPAIESGEDVDAGILDGVVAPAASYTDDNDIYIGASLVLDGDMKLRFYFKGNGLEAFYQDNDQVSKDTDEGYCYFDAAIMPYEICKSITLVTGNTTVTYAPINYIMAKADDRELSELVASIYAYGVAAESYRVTDGCVHDGDITLEVITPATIFSTGTVNKICDICGKTFANSVPSEKSKATLNTITNTADDTLYKTEKISNALGEKSFGPGNDLYLEFSILFDGSIKAYCNGQGLNVGGIAPKDSDVEFDTNKVKNFTWFYFSDQQWAPEGGFEFSAGKKGNSITYGPDWDNYDREYTEYNGSNKSDFVIIDGLDGWHRIGLKYTQNVYENNGNFTYDVTVSVYIDGVLVCKNLMNWGSLFYTVDENGKPKPNLDTAKQVVTFYRYGNARVETEGNTAQLPVADYYLSVGDGWKMPVSKLDTADTVTYTGDDGEEHSAKAYFKFASDDDCAQENHTWANEATEDVAATCTTDGSKSIKCVACGEIKEGTVETIPGGHKWATEATEDVAATCTTDGSKSIKCTVCNAIDPDSVEVIESAGQHVWTETIVTQPTVYSQGRKELTCSACDAEDTAVIANLKASVEEKFTTTKKSSASYYVRYSEILGEGNHFYPTEENPNGQSLYVEFSLLWNDSLKTVNAKDGNYALLGRLEGSSGGSFSPSWLFLKDNPSEQVWASEAGQFEAANTVAGQNIYGPLMSGEAGASYPNIGGYGWHRIGLVYTQLTDTNAPGNMVVSLYVDGDLVSTYYYECSDTCLLYTDNGDGTYTDNVNAKALYYFFREVKTTEGTAYFVVDDMSATAGDYWFVDTDNVENNVTDFVKPVTKRDTPTEGTYTTADGKVIDADQHFAYVD